MTHVERIVAAVLRAGDRAWATHRLRTYYRNEAPWGVS